MSLDDTLFVSMFPDGSARRPGTCFCGQETSDEDEAHCRRCLQDEPPVFQPESPITSDQIQDVGARLVAAAAAPPRARAVTTPAALVVPLQTAAGTLSPHIPVVNASPLVTVPSNSTVQRSGTVSRKTLTEAQAAQKKVTDKQSQQRRIGKMKALQSENQDHQATIKRLEKKIRCLTASLQRQVGGKNNANATTRGGLHEHLVITRYDNWQSVKFALEQAYCHPDSTIMIAARSFFQDEAGEVKVAGRAGSCGTNLGTKLSEVCHSCKRMPTTWWELAMGGCCFDRKGNLGEECRSLIRVIV